LPYFAQHTLLIGKQMITVDQGPDTRLAAGSQKLYSVFSIQYSVFSKSTPEALKI